MASLSHPEAPDSSQRRGRAAIAAQACQTCRNRYVGPEGSRTMTPTIHAITSYHKLKWLGKADCSAGRVNAMSGDPIVRSHVPCPPCLECTADRCVRWPMQSP